MFASALIKLRQRWTPHAEEALDTLPLPVAIKEIEAGKIYQDISQLPKYESILTANGGIYALSELYHTKFAVLKLNSQTALLLADPEYVNRQDYASLLSRVQKDFRVVKMEMARSSVMLNLYAKTKCLTSRRDRDSSETALSVALFVEIMDQAAKLKASDVHFLIREDKVSSHSKIKFRIDGVMRLHDKIPNSNALEAVGVAYTKLAEGTSRSESAFNKMTMLNCAISLNLNGVDYKLRYQTVPVNGGLNVIIRLLQTASDDSNTGTIIKTKSLEELGYSLDQCKQLSFAARKTVGVIIIAGVTGSGKSTTLQTLMSTVPNLERINAFSIETPVEYKIPEVNQINCSAEDFTETMRVVLRSDPDLVMVGEVRDFETCSLLKTMVQSGHQVMTSVHAASGIDIVQRMTSVELGLPRETLGAKNFLSALVYQRLIPKLCACKIPLSTARTDEEHYVTLDILREKFGLDPATMFTTNPDGCEHCSHTGSQGVTVVDEVVIPDNNLLRMFREGRDVDAEEYWRGTRTTGFSHPNSSGKTAFEHGLYKCSVGIIDPYVLESAFEPLETYFVYPMTNAYKSPIKIAA